MRALQRLRLRFADDALERAYRDDEFVHALPRMRAGLAVAVVLYLFFGVLDRELVPGGSTAMAFVRYGLVTPVLLAAALLSYTPFFRKIAEPTIVVGGLVASGGVIAMTVVAPAGVGALYYAGLLLSSMFFYTFFRMRLGLTNLLVWGVFVLYWAVTIVLGASTGAVLFNNLFYLFACNFVGMTVAHSLERYNRSDFLQRRKIERQASHLQTAFLELERKRREAEDKRREAEEAARLDPLTRLYNRRHFFSVAEYEARREHRYPHQVSLIVLDVDQFKQINDTEGHHVGDAVLEHVAQCIRENVRGVDTACRFGGDEFAILLPETEFHTTATVAERLREAIEERAGPGARSRGAVTVSIGVAGSDPSGVFDIHALLERADQALYAAKRAGRNQVRYAPAAPTTGPLSAEAVTG